MSTSAIPLAFPPRKYNNALYIDGGVISNEIIPQTHNKGYERIATTGTIIGIILMLVLDMGL